ncbi:unnamed protein product, partial [marine sediment metagenome]
MAKNIKQFPFSGPTIVLMVSLFLFIMVFAINVFPAMTGLEAHEKYIYPMVRCNGASGTIVYSRQKDKLGVYSTYILTNYHVISDAIRIVKKWDSDLARDIKTEKRSIIYVESFKYRNISTPIGTLNV